MCAGETVRVAAFGRERFDRGEQLEFESDGVGRGLGYVDPVFVSEHFVGVSLIGIAPRQKAAFQEIAEAVSGAEEGRDAVGLRGAKSIEGGRELRDGIAHGVLTYGERGQAVVDFFLR